MSQQIFSTNTYGCCPLKKDWRASRAGILFCGPLAADKHVENKIGQTTVMYVGHTLTGHSEDPEDMLAGTKNWRYTTIYLGFKI